MRVKELFPVAIILTVAVSLGRVDAAEPAAANSVDAKAYAQSVDRAIDFLQNKAQAADGSYAAYAGPGVTAVVTAAILRHGRTPDDPAGGQEPEVPRRLRAARRRHLA